MRVFYREIIYENHEPVNQKIHAEWSDYLKFLLRGLGRRDLDREVVRRHRAVGAIEPIERDAVSSKIFWAASMVSARAPVSYWPYR
jgi:hypothetical protein